MLSAADVIRHLALKPHPEGGQFRETFRDPRTLADNRAASTAIYFLLARGERSHWHRIDAAEVWHWYAGATLALSIADEDQTSTILLGPGIATGERPASDRAGWRLANGGNQRRLDALRLHRRARL